MRQFKNCVEMIRELPREVFTRGVKILDKTVQGKLITEKQGYEQKELYGIAYTINDFSDRDEMIDIARKEFKKSHLQKEIAERWFWDMINNITTKETWFDLDSYSKEYFNEFCNELGTGASSYGYGERLIPQLDSLIKRLKGNIYARGAYIALYDNRDIHKIGHRVPCTLNYGFSVRPTLDGNKMNLFIHMRSQDLVGFMVLDIYKATLLLEYVAKILNVKTGKIICYVDSLHAYQKDIPENMKW